MSVPFSRCGGKSRSAKKIISYFPNDYTLYIEPFFGAGNIFFRLPEDKKTNPMIINDLDDDIFIAMNGLKDDAEYNSSQNCVISLVWPHVSTLAIMVSIKQERTKEHREKHRLCCEQGSIHLRVALC